MKVLFVSHTGLWGGGAEVVLEQLVAESKALGHGVVVALPPGTLLPRLASRADVVYGLPLIPPRRTRSIFALMQMIIGWVRSTLALVRVVRREHPALIYANSGVGALICSGAALLTRTPLIWHQHDVVPHRRVNRLVLGTLGVMCSRLVAVSGAVKLSLINLGIDSGKISVIHNAVRSEYFDPLGDASSSRRELNLPDGPLVVMAGRLVPYKGHQLLLDAVAQLRSEIPELQVVIAGSTPVYEAADVDPFPGYEENLRRASEDPALAGSVHFLGQRDDVRSVLAAADIVAAPAFDEPFPLIVLEALAGGIPVVASDSGGHPEAIEDGVTGLLFKTGDSSDLQRALAGLIENGELRKQLGDNARADARIRFGTDRLRSELAALLSAVAS